MKKFFFSNFIFRRSPCHKQDYYCDISLFATRDCTRHRNHIIFLTIFFSTLFAKFCVFFCKARVVNSSRSTSVRVLGIRIGFVMFVHRCILHVSTNRTERRQNSTTNVRFPTPRLRPVSPSLHNDTASVSVVLSLAEPLQLSLRSSWALVLACRQ